MHPRFDKSTGHLIIEWYEKREQGSPIHHYYSEKPTRLQLHPRDPEKVIRAVFSNKMPGWLEKYAKKHDFKCQQVTRNGEVGFWIANWRIYPDGYKPFTSPSIEGAIEQFTHQIPEVCKHLRDLILENIDIIKQNLENYPAAFEGLGFYYRPEEINGNGGAIVFDNFIPIQGVDETGDEYRLRIEKDGRLERLVYELTSPLPEPVKKDEVDENDVEPIHIEFEEDEELIVEDIEFEDIEDENELSLENIEFIEDEDASNDQSEELSESDISNEAGEDHEDIEGECFGEVVEHSLEDAEEIKIDNEPLEESESSLEQTNLYADVELKITDDENYQVVEGQFSLF